MAATAPPPHISKRLRRLRVGASLKFLSSIYSSMASKQVRPCPPHSSGMDTVYGRLEGGRPGEIGAGAEEMVTRVTKRSGVEDVKQTIRGLLSGSHRQFRSLHACNAHDQ